MQTPPNILVVDDNEAMLHVLKKLMTHEGYRVRTARTGSECLKLARQNHPDLILLDVLLPDLNGVEVAKQIKADRTLSDIFLVHLSAQKAPADVKLQGLLAGADGYLEHPIENRELVIRVRAFLRHKATMDELRDSEARYRDLFQNNPQPMWIYDKRTLEFISMNESARQRYNYRERDVAELTLSDVILAEDFPRFKKASAGGKATATKTQGSWKHRTSNGEIIEVETVEHDLQWQGTDARATLINDVTARNANERERERQLEEFKREFGSLNRISRFSRAPSQKSRIQKTKGRSITELFAKDYAGLLEKALEQRIFKVNADVSEGLEALARQLYEQNAGPRDVVELHYAILKSLAPNPNTPKAQGYLDVGRLSIVELMGYVMNFYRQAAHVQEI